MELKYFTQLLCEVLQHPDYIYDENDGKNINYIIAYKKYIYFLNNDVDEEEFMTNELGINDVDYIQGLIEEYPNIIVLTVHGDRLSINLTDHNLDYNSSKYFIDVLKELKQYYEYLTISYDSGDRDESISIAEIVSNFNKTVLKTKLPKFVYHGTNSTLLRDIMRTGINPTENSNYTVKTHGYTFFASNQYIAKFHAETAHNKIKRGCPIMLEIDSSIFDITKIGYDYDFYSTFIGTSGEHEDFSNTMNKYIIHNKKEEGKLLHLKDKYKGGEFSKFSYKGSVPPKYIY